MGWQLECDYCPERTGEHRSPEQAVVSATEDGFVIAEHKGAYFVCCSNCWCEAGGPEGKTPKGWLVED